ncbi:MAG: CHASE2 domain-containing protein, partial [Myxococcaceae bacterium]|nr:CHASE2 domain-containing protein [Myxococcaceae bacterium]
KFGVAFFWATVFGLGLGAAAYFRVERRQFSTDGRWHVQARLLLERLEWATYDWRARELGEASERSDEVVIVSVDDETIANARESEHPDWAMRPWPRELTGRVVGQLLDEGAALVVVDQSFRDVSPRTCVPCKGERPGSDDDRFAAQLELHDGKVVLTWAFSNDRTRPGDRPLTPVMLRLGDFETSRDAYGMAREALARKAPVTFLLSDGKPVLWAGAASEAKAKELAAALQLKAVTTRPRVPSDDEHDVTESWLAQRLSEVAVAGLDAAQLVKARSIEPPVAPLLLWGAPPGAASLPVDPDAKVRALPLLVAGEVDGRPVVLASAPLLAVMGLVGSRALEYRAGRLRVGDRFDVPMDPDGFLSIRWDAAEPGRGGRGTVKRTVPAWRVLQNAEDDLSGRGLRHYDNDLAGRVVVFSDERSLGGSLVQTPIGPLGHSAVLAQAIVDLLHSNGIVRAPPAHDFWLTVAFAFMGAVLAVVWSTLARNPGWLAWVVTIAGVAALHGLAARQLFIAEQRWVAMAAPVLACALTFLAAQGYARTLERGFRDFIGRALGGAVKADVFARVERDLALMRPERRLLTVYFSDIEGFTAVAQERDPAEVVKVLQAYLNEMTGVVIDSGGHVDKYLGDGLMAFWGAPVDLDDQVLKACEAALEMQARFEARRPELEKQVGRSLVLRAGIETGPTVVGEMGTIHRVNYTVMGEPVATAFRLEAIAKRYGSRVLVAQPVVDAANDEFLFRRIDRLRLGRLAEPLEVYELIGRAVDRERLGPRLERHEVAMKAWRERRFAEALELFKALAAEADDALVDRYVARCERCVVTPPPESWDGVYDQAD